MLLELVVELRLVNPSVLNNSPFAVTPGLPVAGWTLAPLIWLLGIAAVFTGIGLVGFQRRDVG
ncbi:MAG: hypothetical protein H0W02_23565 [Ktedonobacteraceae bacterium]|nr:hypothetical protein [Ktedonobacteraceae bacterium]